MLIEEESVISEDKDLLLAYNLKHSDSRTWFDKLLDSPFLFRRLFEEIRKNGLAIRDQLQLLVLIAACIAYLLSPFDLIPEFVFGILGLLDDLCFVILVVLGTTGALMTLYKIRNEAQLYRNQ